MQLSVGDLRKFSNLCIEGIQDSGDLFSLRSVTLCCRDNNFLLVYELQSMGNYFIFNLKWV